MSQLPSNAPIESNDASAAFRTVRLTVQRVLAVLEDPDATADERKIACNAIREALELHEQPASDGRDHELGAIASGSSSDADCDSQEAAFAEKLRELMKSRAVTQAELASRIGCTQPAISQMLKRKCRPQKSTILSLAAALNVDARELWPDLEVADILDVVAAVQQEQALSEGEAAAFRRALERRTVKAPAAPLPRRKR